MKKIIFGIFLLIVLITANSLNAEDGLSKFLNNLSKALQPTPTPATTPTPQPTRVWVQIVNATIGPAKVDGSSWGGKKVDPSIVAKVGTLLMGSNPYIGILSLLSAPGLASLDKPSSFGLVDVAIDGEYLPRLRGCLFNPCNKFSIHTFTPIFELPSYQNVPLGDGTRFKVTLNCNHILTRPEPIGVAIINSKDLRKALEDQKIYQVPVADQTSNQLLFIGIDVRPAAFSNNQ